MDQNDPFMRGYIACALWSSDDGADVPLDDGRYALAPETKVALAAHCEAFAQVFSDLCDKADALGMSRDDLGHNLWLSRNGHGVGFSDRVSPHPETKNEWDALMRRLHNAARACGAQYLYVGDDDLIYLCPTAHVKGSQ